VGPNYIYVKETDNKKETSIRALNAFKEKRKANYGTEFEIAQTLRTTHRDDK
jgi:hypothetical protein